MRKTFASTVRVVQVPKVAPVRRKLSLEEEALILDQAFRDQSAVASGMDEANRLTEVSEALEDLASLASTIRCASPTEIALIQTSGQMGVAGTTNEPEMLLPAMESFQEGKAIAFENLASKAKVLWKNLLEFLARIWEKIVAFFRVHVVVGDMRRKIAAMTKAITTGGNTLAGQAKSAAEVSDALTYKGKLCTTIADLTQGMKDSAVMAKWMYETYPTILKNAGTKVEQILASFTPDNAEQTLQQLVSQLGGLDFNKFPGSGRNSERDGFEIYISRSFLGGAQLQGKSFKPQPGMHPTAVLEGIRQSGIEVVEHHGMYADEIATTNFEIPSHPQALLVCLQAAETLLAVLENFHKTHLTELKGIADRMRSASSKATQAFEANTADEDGDALREFKSAVNLNSAFAKWTQQPALPFYSQMLRACRAMLIICQIAVGMGQHKQAA